MSALPAVINRDIEQESFRVYVTDTLQAIAENTAIPAASFTNGEAGKAIGKRWIERNDPQTNKKEETRTADEIIEHIRNNLAAL